MKILDILHESTGLQLNDYEKQFLTKVLNGGAELDDDNDFYEKVFSYYLDSGEMPIGTAKARTGDPIQWMTDRLQQEFGAW